MAANFLALFRDVDACAEIAKNAKNRDEGGFGNFGIFGTGIETDTEPPPAPPSSRSADPTEADISRWLDAHHAPTNPGKCAHCEQVETPAAMVVPFGGRSAGHVWLHPECWSAWMSARRAEAVAALTHERIAP